MRKNMFFNELQTSAPRKFFNFFAEAPSSFRWTEGRAGVWPVANALSFDLTGVRP